MAVTNDALYTALRTAGLTDAQALATIQALGDVPPSMVLQAAPRQRTCLDLGRGVQALLWLLLAVVGLFALSSLLHLQR